MKLRGFVTFYSLHYLSHLKIRIIAIYRMKSNTRFMIHQFIRIIVQNVQNTHIALHCTIVFILMTCYNSLVGRMRKFNFIT